MAALVRSAALAVRTAKSDVRCVLSRSASNVAKGQEVGKGKKPRNDSGESGLYDPYKEYEKKSGGSRGYREFNPDNYDNNYSFNWEEPEQMMADKSWPSTSGSELFADLINIPSEPPSGKKLELILAEAFKRMGHTKIADIKLPEIDVAIPEDDEDREALEIMKLSLMNNGRISMDDKNEIMTSLLDEINHLRKDKSTLFKGLD